MRGTAGGDGQGGRWPTCEVLLATCIESDWLEAAEFQTTEAVACCINVLHAPANACRSHQEVRWFWEVLRGFSLEQKRAFLQFTTGSDRWGALRCAWLHLC
jgi:hypothetical protein